MMRLDELKEEPSIAYFPEFCKCPERDCNERGKYVLCYLKLEYKDCKLYKENEK